MNYKNIKIEKRGNYAIIQIANNKNNSLDEKTLNEVANATNHLNKIKEIKCIGLTGGSKFFSPGADIKELEKIGAWAVEVECVPEDVLKEITKDTKALTISIGSGRYADIQFLFGEDILGYHFNSTKTPRHAKKYKDFNKTYEKLQKDRIDAFKEYQKDVVNKKFPSKNNVVFAEKKELEKFKKLIIITPGIRLPDDDKNDQKRIETPGKAIKNGASLLIIGRTITKSINPILSIEKIIQNNFFN